MNFMKGNYLNFLKKNGEGLVGIAVLKKWFYEVLSSKELKHPVNRVIQLLNKQN